MASDDRLVEIMADLLTETHQFRQDSNERFERLERHLERLEDQQIKTNMALGELRLSNLNMANKLEELVELNKRGRVLEDIVLRKAS